MKKKLLILHQRLSEHPLDDELDVLEQAQLVTSAASELGYQTARLEMDLNLESAIANIRAANPDLVFNLVETIHNKGEFAYLAASVLNSLHIPFTGSPLIPLLFSSNKILTKKELVRIGLPTPGWFETKDALATNPTGRYILKPVWEEGSLDLDEHHVFQGNNREMVEQILKEKSCHHFIEEYIDGREFNISILAGDEGPEVLPLAEMQFLDYPEEKPRIVGYKAKWEEQSFESTHTQRTFQTGKEDPELARTLTFLCKKCWNEFHLKGYVRIDFRVSKANHPWVIDINANPCISSNSGFIAATREAGYSYTRVIERIVKDAFR